MHSLIALKVGLSIPPFAVAILWAVFLLRYRGETKRTSAWAALSFASLSGIAALWAVTHLGALWQRSITDQRYEGWAWFFAVAGCGAALVWIVRSRNLCAIGTLLVTSWLSFIWSLW